MDWRIEYVNEGNFIRVTTSGHFSLAEQERMFHELSKFPAPSPSLPILFDNRRIDMTDSNYETMQRSVEIVQQFINAHRIQRLAGLVDEGVNFGIGRQFEILTEVADGHGFRLFKDERLAISWLMGAQ